MKKLLLLLPFIVWQMHAQKGKQLFRVLWYNAENFFDCQHDSLKSDADFIYGGRYGWNSTKYKNKQVHLGRVISSVGEWEIPALVGLCEVENDHCLADLTRNSGLKNLQYKYIHFESPDQRGIDVALLYQPGLFRPIQSKAIRINDFRTRDILYSCGITISKDTLHVFVCHFPSRLDGEKDSEPKRMVVANRLKNFTDSILTKQKRAKIIIMGDFNDTPVNNSLLNTLQAHSVDDSTKTYYLYNLMFPLLKKGGGTHKDNGEWTILDQIIVSGTLLTNQSGLGLKNNDIHIFTADFLLENDNKFMGKKPFRTYNGSTYQNGYSDHLPVYADLWY